MMEKIDFLGFTVEFPTGLDPDQRRDFIDIMVRYGHHELVDAKDGAWIVFGYDTGPYPLYLSKDEISAHRYAQEVGYPVHVKFWIFGEEFGTR